MVLLSWQSRCNTAPGAFDKCWVSAWWLPVLEEVKKIVCIKTVNGQLRTN